MSCSVPDGDYCGGDGVTGDPNILYHCASGVLTEKQVCTTTCVVSTDPSTPDACS